MRIMTSDRRRATGLKFFLDNKGKMVFSRMSFYSGYHQKDIASLLRNMNVGEVFVMNYQHGNTKTTVLKILKSFPNVEILFKTKFKILILSLKDDEIAVEMLRKIIKEELWKLSLQV